MTFRIVAGAALAAGLVFMAGAALASPALTLKGAPLLSGPGSDYVKLVDLPGDMHVDIVWCGLHDNWCLVEEHNTMGWVPLADLKTHVRGKQQASTNDDTGQSGGGGDVVPGKPGLGPVHLAPGAAAALMGGISNKPPQAAAIAATQVKPH